MVRTIGGVIVGYLVMLVTMFVSFSIAYLTMGAEKAFKPGSFDVSALWLVVSFVVGFVTALVGGFVCAAIAKSSKATLALAGLVLILGLAMAVPVLTASDEDAPKVRSGDLGNLEAMMSAKQPGWVALLNPFVGVAGVLLAGRRKEA